MCRKPVHEPSFFKVLIGDFAHKLRIPPAFVKHLDGIWPQKAILETVGWSYKSWHVTIKEIDSNVFFENGWQSFVKEHSLEVGDFLVFEYSGNLKFLVRIYGRTGCEKEASLSNVNGGEIISGLATSENVKPKKAGVAKSRPKRVFESTSSKRNCCCFWATWRSVKGWLLTVPKEVAVGNDLEKDDRLILQDGLGRKWPVVVRVNIAGRVHLGDGISEFLKANNVADGDTCTFEFLQRKRKPGIVMVGIARAKGRRSRLCNLKRKPARRGRGRTR